MTKMHLMWFCAFSPHAGFGMDGWSGPQTGRGYDWTQPELWQDMAMALERAKFDLIMLGDSLAVPGTYRGRMVSSIGFIGTARPPLCGKSRPAKSVSTRPRSSAHPNA